MFPFFHSHPSSKPEVSPLCHCLPSDHLSYQDLELDESSFVIGRRRWQKIFQKDEANLKIGARGRAKTHCPKRRLAGAQETLFDENCKR